jgi:pimeloyl-ACP methyl ester carboxylesterase
MEPRIQYAKTSDGVSIAYWVIGQGPPLVIPPILFANHVQVEWEVPGRRFAYEHLANRATVIHYDCRGLGMSDREAIDFSVEAAIRDLQAVVERAALERFALYSPRSMGEMPFVYAVRFPERITHFMYRPTPWGSAVLAAAGSISSSRLLTRIGRCIRRFSRGRSTAGLIHKPPRSRH